MIGKYVYFHLAYAFFGIPLLSLGIYSLLKNAKEPLNRVFFLFCLTISSSSITFPLYKTSHNFSEAYLWDFPSNFTYYMMVGFFVLFCILFRDRKGLKNPLFYLLIFGPFLLMIYGEVFTYLFDATYIRTIYGIYATAGSLSLLRYLIVFLIYPIIGVFFLIDAFRKTSDPLLKKQAFLIILGTFVALFIGGITDEVLPEIFHITFSLLTFALFVWGSFMLIAITRYRFAQISPDMAVDAIALTLPTALITTDLAEQINYCNSSSVALFKDGLIGKNLMQFSKDEKVKEVASNLSRGISTEWFESTLKKSDTSVFPADIHCSTIAGKDNKIISLLWNIRDLTADLELKQKILGKQKELREKIVEVEQMNEMMKGREARFEELVNELNELRIKFDLPPY